MSDFPSDHSWQFDHLVNRIEQLERRLAQAEERLRVLETQPISYPPQLQHVGSPTITTTPYGAGRIVSTGGNDYTIK